MAKNLIIGAFTGYNYNQLKPWVESIDQKAWECDVILVVGNTDKDTQEKLEAKNVKLMFGLDVTQFPVHVSRFFGISAVLNHYSHYHHVVTTDVKDVYFQRNPFKFFEYGLNHAYPLIASSEGIAYEHEPWGSTNLLQTYGPYVHGLYKSKTIYNVGVLGGTRQGVHDICLNIFMNSINRAIPIVDQAVYNFMLNSSAYQESTLFTDHHDYWAVQAGTMADPTKIEQFRPHLLDDEPFMEDGVIYNCNGEPFCIVHQYDRVPEWKEMVKRKFNQE